VPEVTAYARVRPAGDEINLALDPVVERANREALETKARRRRSGGRAAKADAFTRGGLLGPRGRELNGEAEPSNNASAPLLRV